MLTEVKRTEEDLADWLGTEAGFVAGLCRFDDEPIVLEPFQLAFLENRSRFRWITKSRQVGYSFVAALEALARCHLRDGHTSVFVSFSQDEAKEKILVARQVFDELPLAYQKKLLVDSKTELAFESHAAGRRVSRILSVPSKAPRGKKGDVLLDELAHIVNDREVYTGSTALILRSQGQLTGCSSPLGRRGIFWEIAGEELRKYPHHTRQVVPWWLARAFCRDVARAAREAPHMPTEERVATFGTQGIVEQFDSLPLEDFQQEFECLLPGSLVCTDRGPVDIEKIAAGDRVLTHRGRLAPVRGARRTAYTGEMIAVRTYHCSEALILTPTHPVLVKRLAGCVYGRQKRCYPWCKQHCSHKPPHLPQPVFVPAGELTEQDILLFPVPKQDLQQTPTCTRVRDWFTYPKGFRSKNRLPEEIVICNDWLTLAGYYLAEGHCASNRKRVEFCFHRDERSLAREVHRAVRSLFGLDTDMRVQGKSRIVGVNSVALGNVFAGLFGRLQQERRIPVSWIHLPTERLWYLVRAFMNGDGCRREDLFTTKICSRTLAYQLRDIFVRVGLIPTIRHLREKKMRFLRGRRIRSKEHYDVRVHRARTEDGRGRRGWNDGEYVHLPVRSVRRFSYAGYVYNLHVAQDESFVVGYHAVHNCRFVDESFSYYPYELLLPCTSDELVLADDFTDLPLPEGRIVAGFDVGRTRDHSELAVFELTGGRHLCRLLRRYDQVPFAEQEADLRRLLDHVPVARLSIDRSGIGMNLAENLERDYPQVVGESFTNESKERWCVDFKILLQRKDVTLPRSRELVTQVHSIKRRVLPSGKVSFDAERTGRRGHADRFWAIALACQKERGTARPRETEIGMRVIG